MFFCISKNSPIRPHLISIISICTGQSGLGKSTLMNTLFKSKVSRRSVMTTEEERIPKTIEIKSISHGKKAYRTKLKL